MSSQHLATELLQHIVEKLGEDNETKEGLQALVACSTTNSALLDVSQKHIYRSVTLYDQVPELPGRAPLDYDARYERTQLLLRTFQENPRFVPLARNLSYYFSPGYSGRPGALLNSIRQFTNVETLLVGFYASPINRGVVASTFDEETLSAVFDIMKRPRLRKLVVDSVLSFQMEMIRGAPGMQELILRNSSSNWGTSTITLPPLNAPWSSSLKNLVCDRDSLEQCVSTWLASGASMISLDIFASLERLEICLLTQDLLMDFYVHLLEQTKGLRELDLTVINADSHIELLTGPFTSPIRHLSKSSIQTLTRLSYNMHSNLAKHETEQIPLSLRLPYLGLCDRDTPLLELPSLEVLHINLSFTGHIDLEVDGPACFGTQWGVLADALVVPGAFPQLKEVKVSVTVRSCLHGYALLVCLPLFIKPQFKALEDMCTARAIDFAFTQTVDGS